MRCILGLCVVLAVGSPAWTTEMGRASPEQASQVPSLAIPTTPASNLPAVTTPSISNLQQVPAQLAPTTASPAPAMTNSGTSVVGVQPARDDHVKHDGAHDLLLSHGDFRSKVPDDHTGVLWCSHVLTSGYSTPTQTYYTVPQQQVFYQPVQQRRGLIWPLSTALAAAGSPGLHEPWLHHVRVRKHGLCDPWLHNSGLHAHHILLYTATPSGTVPASTVSAGTTAPAATTPAYSPTMYTAPNSTAPAGATSAPDTPPVPGTAPAATTPTGTIPSVVNPPAPPAVKLPGTTPK